MSTISVHIEQGISHRVLRHSKWDALLVSLALLHGLLLLLLPSPIMIAVGMWWDANTVAHNFIHRPFFRSAALNRFFSFYLSLVLGIPQTIWRSRHLAHHAQRPWKLTLTPQLMVEGLGVGLMWAMIAAAAPKFFVMTYVPGYLAGLVLCWLQGKFEHVRGTTSHYGWIYNFLFFNDGYHVEHHANPGVHWRELAWRGKADERPSRWPAVLRWLEGGSILGFLERLVLKSARLQSFVLDRHERAMRKVLTGIEPPRRAAVVGGGLFPRSLIVLKRIYPAAEIVGIEGEEHHIEIAREFAPDAKFVSEWFDEARHGDFDLLVIPLAFVGDRAGIYRKPPGKFVVIHDWLWRSRGRTAVISLLLLKRLNLVMR